MLEKLEALTLFNDMQPLLFEIQQLNSTLQQ